MIADRLAHEYGWTPEVIRRLTIRQVKAYWQAIGERYAVQAETSRAARPGRSAERSRAPVEQSSRADGRITRSYNLAAMGQQLAESGVKDHAIGFGSGI